MPHVPEMLPRGMEGMMEEMGAGPEDAASMNSSLSEVISKLEELLASAEKFGVYDDRGSIAAIENLINLAQGVQARWMKQQPNMSEARQPEQPPLVLARKAMKDRMMAASAAQNKGNLDEMV